MLLLILIISFFIIQPAAGSEGSVKNRIIYLIHGDGDYVYHDNKGEQLLSDEMVLQQALKNAESAGESEYFIFHFKPKRTFLLFFPGEESYFYHYKKGSLISEKKYFRFDPVNGHSAEAHLINEASPDNDVKRNFLLYYGHEIPLEEEYGYNASFPEVPFGLQSFKGRITEILSVFEKPKIDVLVLSTCNNGAPEFIFELSEIAEFIVAAPGDLHLSQMNSNSLKHLEEDKNYSAGAYALRFAAEAFAELSINAFTEVTVSVYCTKNLINGNYNPDAFCNPKYAENGGVKVFFRPSKFGKDKAKYSHSGWYCKDSTKLTTKAGE